MRQFFLPRIGQTHFIFKILLPFAIFDNCKSVCFNLGLSIKSLFSRRTKDPANTVKSDTKIEFLNDISDIDYYAKIIFPTCFFTFNLVYWVYYLGKRELYL